MSEALSVYKSFFPKIVPSIYQQELIEAGVSDLEAWKSTLEFWAGSGYRPQNVFKMLDHYEQQRKSAVMDSPESIVQALHSEFDDLTNPTLSHIGVLQTLMRRTIGGYDSMPITSHKYFLPEARHLHQQVAMTELRPATIETVLAVRRGQYERMQNEGGSFAGRAASFFSQKSNTAGDFHLTNVNR